MAKIAATLFISHASEDQSDFVRPLAEALAEEYEKVWYAPYVLTLGDSLLQKINEGLVASDFGIVVLSKYFFEKKWPRAELDGLFALETQSNKIILPIWKDITEDEVRAFSPILAGRLAVSTTAGLQKVLEEIRLAVTYSERQRELSAVDVAVQRVKAFRETIADKRRVELLLSSERGAELVSSGIETLWQTVQAILSEGKDKSSVQFGFKKNSLNHMHVYTVRGMYLSFRATNLHSNATRTVLETKIFQKMFDRVGQATSDLIEFCNTDFKPSLRSGDELVWIDKETSSVYSTGELAGHLVDLFLKHLQEMINSAEE